MCEGGVFITQVCVVCRGAAAECVPMCEGVRGCERVWGLGVFITQVCVVCRGAAAECVPMSGECRRNGDDGN